jgi:hypothetical protein
MNRNLYALLIGINKYKDPDIKNLYGCERDVDNVRDFLTQKYVKNLFISQDITVRKGDEATKKEIVKQWEGLIKKAHKNDVVLFYFSGHGGREKTNLKALGEFETDGNISTLVCHDSIVWPKNPTDESCLADKELRWLIGQLYKSCENILTIFDCCHSGGNTRNFFPENHRQIERRALEPRSWNSFIFSDKNELSKERFEQESLKNLLPEGAHIQMAACRDIELAIEEPARVLSERQGVFTKAMLDVLEAYKGRITYQELNRKVVYQLRSRGSNAQTPQIYYPGKVSTALRRMFLTNELYQKTVDSPVIYNKQKQEWSIGMGVLLGIDSDPDTRSSKVSVYAFDDPEQKWEAEIVEVFLSHSILNFTSAEPPQGLKYRASVTQLAIDSVEVSIIGQKKLAKQVEEGMTALLKQEELNPLFEITPKNGDYQLSIGNGILHFFAIESGSRALLKPICLMNDNQFVKEKVELVFNDLQQLAKWNYLKNLNFNSFSTPDEVPANQFPIETRIYQLLPDGYEQEINLENGSFTLSQLHGIKIRPSEACSEENINKRNESLDIYALIRIELQNHYTGRNTAVYEEKGLCCSLLYMVDGFGVYSLSKHASSDLPDPVFWMKKGELTTFPNQFVEDQTERDKDSDILYYKLYINDYIYKDNWPGQQQYFKLIVSEQMFHVDDILVDPLDLPYEPSSGETRSFRGPRRTTSPAIAWEVKTFGCFFNNPLYCEEEKMK